MDKQQDIVNYNRIASAIEYVKVNFQLQPTLEDIASHVHVSPTHFQRIFQDWAGTSPKKFLQYISLQHAKKLLKEHQTSLAEATYHTGLSSTSRLHDLFLNIEGMSPAEYKLAGKGLQISYGYYPTPFGTALIASTQKGICMVAFEDDAAGSLATLRKNFSCAVIQKYNDPAHLPVLDFFAGDWTNLKTIKLHLRGTAFQLKVWEALLKIPMGKLTTYQYIARELDNENAARAVGTAIGNNPIAFLIPCHRVIQSSGLLGGYRWGLTRKTALIVWESMVLNKTSNESV
ncbi:MAG: methylated-DNA--[protein]-cysteine S-methyltransferase [Sphingobacterium sp.]|uniref:methylated-DNA--[protein]-cysteine S-methyltransferase n=1 Tax=Sphingobacterium sp. JB170 TaxID=1434842 RepID=UPI00097EAFBD|nr:methylated-DNA--[protein]-cysteine S-methyltransferase [Sphingobacterium sp. JB170]SJN25749.1 ADA regulatory protein / Methylated-DNA--protein-cysteine methyltransferase [Sphingobacterium sp. JB170]